MDYEIVDRLAGRVDTVIHLAAAVGVQWVIENLVDTLNTNTKGTKNVLISAKAHGVQNVLIASTSEVYGKNPNMPYSEDDDVVIGPSSIGRWGYACSKMFDEYLALAYHKEQGLPVTIVRLFNTTGPRQTGRYGMVVPRFVSAALKNETITIHGNGNQTRCFAHVEDVAAALIKISKCAEAVGEVYNLGSEQRISINELASVVKEITGSNSPVVHIPYSEVYGPDFEDMVDRIPDISKINEAIDYVPQRSLTEIVRDVADYLALAAQSGNDS